MPVDSLTTLDKRIDGPGLGWGLAGGLLLALLVTMLPAKEAAKYVAAAIAVYYIWQRPQWGLYLILAGLAFLPTSLIGRLVLLTTGVAIVKRWVRGRCLTLLTGVDLPCGIFFALVGLAACSSVAKTGSLSVLPLYGLYLATFYLAAMLPRPRDVSWLLGGLLLAGMLAGLMGLLQYKSGIQTSLSWIDLKQAEEIKTRVFGPFDNPNIFAEYLTFVLPVALVLWLTERRFGGKLIWTGVAVVTGAALVATFSRGGWLAALTGVLVLGLVWEPRLLVLTALVAMALPALAPQQVVSRAASIGSLEDSSNVFRLSIWAASLKMIAAYWLTGIGPGTAAFNQVYPRFMIAGTPAIHSHNLYLQLALELGVPGLLAFLWLLLAVFSRSFMVLPRLSYHDRGVLAALLAALTGFLLHGAVDNVWYSPKLTLLFWLTLGLAVAMGKGAGGSAGAACNQ